MAIVGDVGGVRHLGDGGVGDQHGAAARQHERHADDAMAGLGIDAAAHVFERDREIAGDAGDHGVGVAERHHAGGEVIAVLIDQPLAVALQIAVALQPLVEIRRVGGVARRQAALTISMRPPSSMPSASAVSRTRGFAADQQRRAEPLVHEARRGADHLLLLALGEDDAPRLPAQPLVHALQHAGDRIAPRAQLLPVGVHVDDRPARDLRVHRRLRHRRRNVRDQPRIERHRNDVVGPVFRPRAVGRGDLVGHVLARQLRPAPAPRRSSSPC